MRERYNLGLNEALFFAYVLIGITLLLIWNETSHTGAIVWAVFLGAVSPLPRIVHSLDVSFTRWFRFAFAAEVLGGFGWGSLTWLALPESDVRQALLCTVLVGVMVAASISAAQFRALNLAFLLPYATLSIGGYLFNPNGLTAATIFLGVAFAFSALMASEHRSVHISLVSLLTENEELVTKLENEHLALTEANELLDNQAWTDSLTGLANRPAMVNELSTRLRRLPAASDEHHNSTQVTLAYIDLNGFKQVNDVWGHHTGDLLLLAVATRLRDAVAMADEHALASRLGGDEFVVISSLDAAPLASQLARAFDEPLEVGDRRLPIQLSIGVATASSAVPEDEILRNADKALYRHKNATGSSAKWQIFDDSMRHELEVRDDLKQRVHTAFADGDITVFYQPIVDLITGEIHGAEALARWVDADGVRTAGSFLDVLTEEGLLDDLTERTFASVCAVQSAVEETGQPRPHISINVAPQQLEQVLTLRSREGDLECIAIEITEDSAIPNFERVVELLTRARELGAEILVDDFGTGYSSLARTAALPIDGLKIDQSFVATLTRVESSAVVSTVVDLADKLGLSVIAEGIETQEQVDELLRLGVAAGQGFLFAEAVEADVLVDWLSNERCLWSGPDDAAAAA